MKNTLYSRFPFFPLKRLCCLSIAALLALQTGCTTYAANNGIDKCCEKVQSLKSFKKKTKDHIKQIPVVRYGRYTLVEIVPEVWQVDLLSQIIVIAIPPEVGGKGLTVADGMRHVLKNSGYSLCADVQKLGVLQKLPLPLAHAQLGPLSTHDALVTLAGSAWKMQVDEQNREVCFISRITKAQDAPIQKEVKEVHDEPTQ